MTAHFDGRTAIVTGGSRSIGRATAVALASEGANVVVNYRSDRDAADATVAEITDAGGTGIAVRADVADHGQVAHLVDAAVSRFGGIDLLVNNAAVLHRTPVLDIEPDEWDRVLRTNLSGAFFCAQLVARQMARQQRGAIVNVTSINDRRARPGLSHYSVSKAGLSMLTRQMALELAGDGIRVNAVALGLIETDMNRRRLGDPDVRRDELRTIPLGVIGGPADAVGPILFLLSDAARLITGSVLVVDAGKSLT
jgi:3-oxoacyl-[acyl-carrier protein] reductase